MTYRLFLTASAALAALICSQSALAQSSNSESQEKWDRLKAYEGIVSEAASPEKARQRLFRDKNQNQNQNQNQGQARRAPSKTDSGWMDLKDFTAGYETSNPASNNSRNRANPQRPSAPQPNTGGWQDLSDFHPEAASRPSMAVEPTPYQNDDQWVDINQVLGSSNSIIDLASTPLAAGDDVHIDFAGIEDMSGLYKISDIGTLDMPLIGNIRASGMTSPEVQRSLEQIYGQDYLNNPQITLTLQPRPLGDVNLEGLINLPGQYAMTETLSLAEALAKGAGVTGRASERDAVISRRIGNSVRVRRVALEHIKRGGDSGPTILPGDNIIIVKREQMPAMTGLNAADFPLLTRVLRSGSPVNF